MQKCRYTISCIPKCATTCLLVTAGICLVLCLTHWSCSDRTDSYSFFVAGHAYGSPTAYSGGLHPPFAEVLDQWAEEGSHYIFGVLTGDVVPRGTRSDWIAVRRVIDSIGIPVYIAPGNHDLIDPRLYAQYVGSRYQAFTVNGDLFILMDGSDGWNITGAQIAFLTDMLTSHPESRVFVFVHQLLWWEPEGVIAFMKPNWQEGRGDTVNFGSAVLPLLRRNQPVYLFAGDVGAQHNNANLYYHRMENMHFIASGMGNGRYDHYLDVLVSLDSVRIRCIPLDENNPTIVLTEEIRMLPAEH